MARSDWKRPTEFPLAPGYRRIRITVSYDGASFSGWQRQQDAPSVQQEIEKALKKILKTPVTVSGSGRTDAKVHAIGQIAHFDIANQSVPVKAFPVAINQLLPHAIRIIDACEVDGTFHARFTSSSREYRYIVKEEKDYTPFDRNRVGRVRQFPPLDVLNAYASCIIGTHDFSTFSASADQSHSKIREVYISGFYLEPSQWGGMQLVYRVCANAYLMHQVRSMVGSMLQFASKGYPVEEFKRRLIACDRFEAGRTAGPEGLYLYRISYDQ
ncbi:MAG: tRNA pseudouridine(38-40) synthase TruA [Sphaerochaetaceae bacterium]|nr:tRNA pseudouridine(38-40) synthase TruA [Sphaerochaetaceae bacterium]